MSRYRVCFISPYTYTYFAPQLKLSSSGSEKQMYYLSRTLAQRFQFDVHFLVANYGQAVEETVDHVNIHNVFRRYSGNHVGIFGMLKAMRRLNAKSYIFRSPALYVAIGMLYGRYVLRKRVIYMITNDLEVSNLILRKYFNAWIAFVMKIAYRTAHHVIAQNEEQKELFLQNRNIRVSQILNSLYPRKRTTVNMENKLNIMWVGRCVPEKRPDIFIDLAEHFPQYEFVMVCSRESRFEKYFTKIRESAYVASNLKFIKQIPPDEIHLFYKRAICVVNTSEFEGFPNTFLEAIAYQCVLVSYKIDPNEIFAQNKIGYLANGSIDNLQRELQELMHNADLREQFLSRAMAYLNRNHDPKKLILEITPRL